MKTTPSSGEGSQKHLRKLERGPEVGAGKIEYRSYCPGIELDNVGHSDARASHIS